MMVMLLAVVLMRCSELLSVIDIGAAASAGSAPPDDLKQGCRKRPRRRTALLRRRRQIRRVALPTIQKKGPFVVPYWYIRYICRVSNLSLLPTAAAAQPRPRLLPTTTTTDFGTFEASPRVCEFPETLPLWWLQHVLLLAALGRLGCTWCQVNRTFQALS